jgi:hypothetical protein
MPDITINKGDFIIVGQHFNTSFKSLGYHPKPFKRFVAESLKQTQLSHSERSEESDTIRESMRSDPSTKA